MSIEAEFISSAQSRIGARFQHHFKPNDYCFKGRITIQKCMEKGMTDEGYDCSGLVIASLCDVLGLKHSEWPISLRHQAQLKTEAADVDPKLGDIVLFGSHIAVYAAPEQYVHASGISKIVEEGKISGGAKAGGVITLQAITALASPTYN